MMQRSIRNSFYSLGGSPAQQLNRVRSHLRTPLYRNGYALLVTAVTTSLLGIVFWAAAVRFYTPDVVGFSSAAISAMVLVTGLASFSLQGVLVRFLPAAGARAGRLILLAYAIHASMALLLGTLFVHTVVLWAPNLGALSAGGVAGWGFVLGAVVWSMFNLQDGALTGLRHAVWVPVENILYAVGKMVLLVLLANGMPHWGIFAAWVIPAAAAIIPINLLLRRLVPQAAKVHSPQVRAADCASIARYIVRNYPGALFSLALSSLMPLVVSQQAGLRANAYFYMPWMIYIGLQLVPINLATSMTVEAVHDERKLGLFSYRVLVQSLRLLGPVVVALLLGAHWLLLAFGPEYAAQGEILVRLLALAAIPNILVVLYISVLRVENRGWNLVLVQAAQAVLLLGLSYWLLPLWGITGVGVAALASQTFVAAALVLGRMAPLLRKGRAEHLSGQINSGIHGTEGSRERSMAPAPGGEVQ
jgi:O-antigen/teichoic acid export membrane protein